MSAPAGTTIGEGGLTIRRPTGTDAQQITNYLTRLVNEPHNKIVRDPGQWDMSVEDERKFLERAAASNDLLFLIAELNGDVAGVASIERHNRPTVRHCAVVGLSVDASYRRRGVGLALMKALIAWAVEQKLRRIELKVFTRNAAAIALYEKLGFQREGLHRMAALKQGIWVDDYTMALLLDPAQ